MEPGPIRIPQIISVSRRTDIPAWHAEWFIQRLKAGVVQVKAPFSEEMRVVSLKPEDVLGFVFWSKNFKPLLPHLDKIEAVTPNLHFHLTLTGAPSSLEPHSPQVEETVKDFIYLLRRYSSHHVMWRFDPVCVTDRYSFEEHLENFGRIAEKLKDHAHACTISFVQPYAKVLRNFKLRSDHVLSDLSVGQKQDYGGRLAAIARDHGLRLQACCNDFLVSDAIDKAHCIDKNRLAGLWGIPLGSAEPYAPTRKECGCTRSIDIGGYDTCPNGCLYCYANSSGAVSGSKLQVPS